MRVRFLFRLALVLTTVFAFGALTALASAAEPKWDLPTRLVAETPEMGQLRQQFAGMTEAQVIAAGYEVDAIFITAAMVGLPASTGAMGYHAINNALMGAQFPTGSMDPKKPPILLLNADKKVVGIEWEAANLGQTPPTVHGQTANLGPAHPGAEQPHFMLHAYFRPNGQVLYGDFDPTLTAPPAATTPAPPGLPNTGAGGRQVIGGPLALATTLAILIAGIIAAVAARRRPAR